MNFFKIILLVAFLHVFNYGFSKQPVQESPHEYIVIKGRLNAPGLKIDTLSLSAIVMIKSKSSGTLARLKTIGLPLNSAGEFCLRLPDDQVVSNLWLYERKEMGVICKDVWLLPDSKVELIVAYDKDTGKSRYKYLGNGRAAFKYSAARDSLENDLNKTFNQLDQLQAKITGTEQKLSKQLSLLKQFRTFFPTSFYALLRSELIGKESEQLLNQFYAVQIAFHPGKTDLKKIKEEEQFFSRFLVRKIAVPAKNSPRSLAFINFLFETVIARSFLLTGKPDFKATYNFIRKTYKGEYQESLLTTLLSNGGIQQEVFNSVEAKQYKELLQDGVWRTHKEYQKTLQQILDTRTQGAMAFNFDLPADSSTRRVKLSDFRGKVILQDLWAYQCTACTLFAQIFHEKIYPFFKDNPDFVDISIMASPSDRKSYMFRLRSMVDRYGKQFAIYTYPDNVNLYSGSEEANGSQLDDHYRLNVFPTLMLIGRDGRIISSTFHIFTDDNDTESINQLKELITNALKQ